LFGLGRSAALGTEFQRRASFGHLRSPGSADPFQIAAQLDVTDQSGKRRIAGNGAQNRFCIFPPMPWLTQIELVTELNLD
jgi:hypothetical protein